MYRLFALLLLTAPLVGCIGTDEALDPQAVETPDILDDRVTSFTGAGDILPVDEVVATAEYLLTGHEGAEPNMGFTQSGAMFVTASDKVLRSTDEGESWEVVYHFVNQDDGVIPTQERGAVRTFDPMLWVDPVTDIVYADPMYPPLACTHLAWSEDDGETWFERPGVCHPGVMDHQKLATGLPGPQAPPMAGVAHETVLYQCYNSLLATLCGTSYDGGLTWINHQVAGDEVRHGCGGINGHPAASPDGVVAVPITSCHEPGLAMSWDNGVSWSFQTLPGATGIDSIDAEVAWSPDGVLYYSFRGDDHITYLSYSTDEGESWVGPIRVTPPGVTSTVFHALAAGPGGKLAVGFLGTEDTDAGPDGADDDARWHLYLVTTEDALAEAPVFTSHQATPEEDPVQVGRICMGGVGCDDGSRNLLDFIDGGVSPDGTFHVAYTEGCVDGCAGEEDASPEDSRSRIISIARLDGWTLTG
ncbi:MAG: sialidase family protein [Candidatus Thermoplasmatota archaeon]|nr:sialidase family protein [Candidatus Thermoplasmatota archaeon]